VGHPPVLPAKGFFDCAALARSSAQNHSVSKISRECGVASFATRVRGSYWLSNPNLPARLLKTPVATSQVAPTILRALGIDAQQLKSVRVEGTKTLPQ
jgi:hypothetical protein